MSSLRPVVFSSRSSSRRQTTTATSVAFDHLGDGKWQPDIQKMMQPWSHGSNRSRVCWPLRLAEHAALKQGENCVSKTFGTIWFHAPADDKARTFAVAKTPTFAQWKKFFTSNRWFHAMEFNTSMPNEELVGRTYTAAKRKHLRHVHSGGKGRGVSATHTARLKIPASKPLSNLGIPSFFLGTCISQCREI